MVLAVLAFAFGVAAVMAVYMGITKVPGMIAQRRLQGRQSSCRPPRKWKRSDAPRQGPAQVARCRPSIA